MNRNVTQSAQSPLARVGRRIAAIIAECNYADLRTSSLRDTPAAYRTVAN
jgi:hypothetical protein